MAGIFTFLAKMNMKLRKLGMQQCQLAGRRGRKANLNWKLFF